jgi:parallel beta-helix repeat protein
MVNKYTILSSRSGVIVTLLSLSSTILVYFSSSSSSQITESTSSCITYDSSEKIITITCKSANLTDIDNQLKDPGILHNGHYGLDPHTGTHDMIIRNNTVHDNGSIGIICSLDCYNITIENNIVYNNTKMGIMFSRNMYDSVARNNIVSNEDRGIVISESHNNEIYNNTVSDSGSGIDLDTESSKNKIQDNIVANIPYSSALVVEDGAAEQNMLYSNTLVNSNGQRISLDQQQKQQEEEQQQ